MLFELGNGQHLRHVAADVALVALVGHLIPGIGAVVFAAQHEQQGTYRHAIQRRAGGGRRAAQVHLVLDQLGVGAGGIRADRLRGHLGHRGRRGELGFQLGEVIRRLLLAHRAHEVGADVAPLAAVLHEIPGHAVRGDLTLEEEDHGLLIEDRLQVGVGIWVAAQRRAVIDDAGVDIQALRRGGRGRLRRGGGLDGRGWGGLGRFQRGKEVCLFLLAHQADVIREHIAPLVFKGDKGPHLAVIVHLAALGVNHAVHGDFRLQVGVHGRIAAQLRVIHGHHGVALKLDGRGGRGGRCVFLLGGRGRRGGRFGRRLLGLLRHDQLRIIGIGHFRLDDLRLALLRRDFRIIERGDIVALLAHIHQLDELGHHIAFTAIRAHVAPVAFHGHDPQHGTGFHAVIQLAVAARLFAQGNLLAGVAAVVIDVALGQLLRDIRNLRLDDFRLFGGILIRLGFFRLGILIVAWHRREHVDRRNDVCLGGFLRHFLDLVFLDVAGLVIVHVAHEIPDAARSVRLRLENLNRRRAGDHRNGAALGHAAGRLLTQDDGHVVFLRQRHGIGREGGDLAGDGCLGLILGHVRHDQLSAALILVFVNDLINGLVNDLINGLVNDFLRGLLDGFINDIVNGLVRNLFGFVSGFLFSLIPGGFRYDQLGIGFVLLRLLLFGLLGEDFRHAHLRVGLGDLS